MTDERECVVLSIGGSVLVPLADDDGEQNLAYVKDLAGMLLRLCQTRKLFVVAGGGRTARAYISWGRRFSIPEKLLDEVGIAATRLNARLLAAILGDKANQAIPETVRAAAKLGEVLPVVVMGGTVPGHTTDAVSALLAAEVGARTLVNATSVDGVYTDDPRKNPAASKIPALSHQELLELTEKARGRAGANIVFDPVGAEVIAKEGIKLKVVDGRDLPNLERAMSDQEFKGSTVD